MEFLLFLPLSIRGKQMKDLRTIMHKIRSTDEAKEISELIFTKKERETFELRIKILKLLLTKNFSHREIASKLHVSISKVTNGSKAIQEASEKTLVKFERIYSTKKP